MVQSAKFSTHVMVSAEICFGGKGRQHFVPEKVKVNANFYIKDLLPKLIEDCNRLLLNGYVFQQDGAPAHFSHLAQEWIGQHCPEFIKKDEWPQNSLDLNPLDHHIWGAMLEKYKAYTPKSTNKAELKTVLEAIWEDLPQDVLDQAVLAFWKRLQARIRAEGSHFEHVFK